VRSVSRFGDAFQDALRDARILGEGYLRIRREAGGSYTFEALSAEHVFVRIPECPVCGNLELGEHVDCRRADEEV
jgi:hypothetical protein